MMDYIFWYFVIGCSVGCFVNITICVQACCDTKFRQEMYKLSEDHFNLFLAITFVCITLLWPVGILLSIIGKVIGKIIKRN